MEIEDLEKELTDAGWTGQPRDKLLGDIEETSRKLDAKLKRRVKECGVSVEQVLAGKMIQIGSEEVGTRGFAMGLEETYVQQLIQAGNGQHYVEPLGPTFG